MSGGGASSAATASGRPDAGAGTGRGVSPVVIGAGVTLAVGLSALAYYLYRRGNSSRTKTAEQSLADVKRLALSPSVAAATTAAAGDSAATEQYRRLHATQMALVANALAGIHAVRDVYRGAAPTANAASPDAAAAAAATTSPSYPQSARNGRIRLRLLLDQLTHVQHTLLALHSFLRTAVSVADLPLHVPLTAALQQLHGAIDGAQPDVRACQRHTRPQWLLEGGQVRVRLFAHSESVWRAHTAVYGCLTVWRDQLSQSIGLHAASSGGGGGGGGGGVVDAAALRMLTVIRPSKPPPLQDLTRDEEDVEDAHLLGALTPAELQQTLTDAFGPLTAAVAAATSPVAAAAPRPLAFIGPSAGSSAAGATAIPVTPEAAAGGVEAQEVVASTDAVVSYAARRARVLESVEHELSVADALQRKCALLVTAAQVFAELDRDTALGLPLSGSNTSGGLGGGDDVAERADDPIALLFRAEQARLSLQAQVAGLNASLRAVALKLRSNAQSALQLRALLQSSQQSAAGSSADDDNGSVANARLLLAQNEESSALLVAERTRAESQRSRLLAELDATKRRVLLLKAVKNLPALFRALNATAGDGSSPTSASMAASAAASGDAKLLRPLHGGALVATLQTIAKWSLCVQPHSLPSASDVFLMRHQIAEGIRLLTDTLAHTHARVVRLIDAFERTERAAALHTTPRSRAAGAGAGAAPEREAVLTAVLAAFVALKPPSAAATAATVSAADGAATVGSSVAAARDVTRHAPAADAEHFASVLHRVRDETAACRRSHKTLVALARTATEAVRARGTVSAPATVTATAGASPTSAAAAAAAAQNRNDAAAAAAQTHAHKPSGSVTDSGTLVL